MEVSRGANLVGMSMLPLDVCPLSLLIKKKRTKNIFLSTWIALNLYSTIIRYQV